MIIKIVSFILVGDCRLVNRAAREKETKITSYI